MLDVVIHGIAQPGDFPAERSARFGQMHEPFFHCERLHVTVPFRMCKTLVNEVELHAARRVITVNRLQTGGVAKEGRSGQAAEHEYGVFPLEAPQFDWLAVGIEQGEVGKLLADIRSLGESAVEPPSARTAASRSTLCVGSSCHQQKERHCYYEPSLEHLPSP